VDGGAADPSSILSLIILSKLCDSERQQRDELLKRIGGSAKAFDARKREEISRLYRRYYLE